MLGHAEINVARLARLVLIGLGAIKARVAVQVLFRLGSVAVVLLVVMMRPD